MVSHRVEGWTRCADTLSRFLPWVNHDANDRQADMQLTGSVGYSRCRPDPDIERVDSKQALERGEGRCSVPAVPISVAGCEIAVGVTFARRLSDLWDAC